MQDLGTMGGQAVGPRGVNDHGQVVGIVSIGGNANAFSWTSTGGVRLIDPLGHVWSYALAINNAGVIVGSLFGTSAYGVPDMAFIEVDSVTYNLNTLIVPNNGPYLQFANAISEDGRIAGDAAGGGVFVLTPCLGNALVEPSTTSICPSGTATFSVTAAGTGPFSYQWQVADPAANGGWTNIADGTMLWNGDAIAQFRSGNPAVLSVELFFDTYEQGRSVRCIVSNACGSVTSDSATLTVCRADFNCSGNTDGDDLFDFLDAWFAQNGSSGSGLSADIDSSGTVDSDDLFAFLDLWFAENGNCP
jgi:hypothetical protein